ncbi:MAG: hypothetical protein Q7T96_00940 [Methylobacter sp.]|nr:hypothetical protein [Methylobacter sp.]
MLKNKNVLIVNKRYKQDFTQKQLDAAAKHRDAGGVIIERPYSDESLPELEFVNISRDGLPIIVQQPAPAVVEERPWREWNYATSDWQYN